MTNSSPLQTFMLTILALIAFAANSVLCRMALGQSQIDGASFTLVRLVSGAVTMLVIMAILKKPSLTQSSIPLNKFNTWLSPLMLFGYGWCFSYAYLELNTATGALILFATVQLSMLGYGLYQGNRPNTLQWLGIIMALGGFVYLMLPSATQPDLIGFIWMWVAGLCWAVYTVAGKANKDAIAATNSNFVLSVPLVVVASLIALFSINIDINQITSQGIILAMLSGCFASACGYTLWYLALKNLTITQAAISQLSVPVIAAIGGIIWMSEPLTTSFALSASLILLGIMLVTLSTAKS